eukprot:CAMPEP_0185260300 /NCGR_PEP_ID=MMETSP1359-20130426/8908_1 /TAXON_ID=552665 /ORGANISM="Bigelowiella longifila, Strain CCMP242" /LENGTH=127 /DNA_ID=CAMNT_0027846493 /DNA_START=374 /DNA_END=755 /DNA_ORIENTATION=-
MVGLYSCLHRFILEQVFARAHFVVRQHKPEALVHGESSNLSDDVGMAEEPHDSHFSESRFDRSLLQINHFDGNLHLPLLPICKMYGSKCASSNDSAELKATLLAEAAVTSRGGEKWFATAVEEHEEG